MSEERDCVVKLVDDHGVEHSVRVRAKSVYEAALRGLNKLARIGWEGDGSQIGCATPAVVQRQLRHSDARITLEVYGHVIGDEQRSVVQIRSTRLVN